MARHSSLKFEIDVRWGDMDAFGHVNNTCFLRYLEEARLAWFTGMNTKWQCDEYGPVVVNINCNFRREIQWPCRLLVTLDARLASEKRVVLEHTIIDTKDSAVVYSDASLVLVWIDRQSGKSIPLPQAVRRLFTD
jgi:acyl-CoA thioester hydrolase